MPDETDNVPAKADAPLQVNTAVLPERAYAVQKVSDPLPPAMIERVGQMVVTDEQAEILTAPVPDDEIDIRPDGFIYVSHEYCRRQLNLAFKPLGWTMIEASPIVPRPGTNEFYQKWALFIGGVFAGVTMASRQMHDKNAAQDMSDVYESIKSDCIRRLCKDLGLGIEAWNKRRQKQWRDQYAVKMLCRTRDGNKAQWRRIDADPFTNWEGKSIELGEAKDVPESPDGKRAPQQSAPPPPQPEPPRAPKVEVVPDSPKQAAPPTPPKAGGMKILPAQERMIFARMRTATLLVGDDGLPAMEWLMNEMGIELIQDDGKTSAENLAAMIKEIPGARVTECAKKLDAMKGAANA